MSTRNGLISHTMPSQALPLHASGDIAAHKVWYLSERYQIQVACNRVLQRRGCHREAQRLLLALANCLVREGNAPHGRRDLIRSATRFHR